jgi:hypothetical protein
MADLGLPAPILDRISPWSMLATRVIHLGSWRRSAGVAMARATAWAARVSRARWHARVPVPTVASDLWQNQSELHRLKYASPL